MSRQEYIFLRMLSKVFTKECMSCHKTDVIGSDDLCLDCHEQVVSRDNVPPPTKTIKEDIPSDLRWAIWDRDNFTCQNCGSRHNLTIDHVYPESKGGKISMENGQTLCKSCNSRKGAR